MPQLVRLSYEIRFDAPGWPGNPTYAYEQLSSTARGDFANFGLMHLMNHFGSHLDAPNHFNPGGIKVAEVPLDRFVYERPALVELGELGDSELVGRRALEAHDERLREADLVLLRSGWSSVRASDPRRYAHDGPGVSPEACEYLLSLPRLKAVAMDWISLAAYRKIDPEGIRAHQLLCGLGGDRYLVIAEDIDLSEYPDEARRVYAIPLFPQDADSSPCTVFAEVAE
jgi:kynurenine formamidase